MTIRGERRKGEVLDVRLPLPLVCTDCGADVLARADIEGPETQRRLPFNGLRTRKMKP